MSATSRDSAGASTVVPAALEEVVRSFPAILDSLRESYAELQERAARVETELCRANAALEDKVRELDRLKSHLEAVLQSLPTGVIVRDAGGRIVRVNHAALDILGLAEDELGATDARALLRDVAGGHGETRELALRDGSRLVLASSRSTVRLGDGSVAGSVEILDDRTEQTSLAERLHAADKMAALGTLAAGVAHELRNPLNAVKGFAALLRREAEDDARRHRWASLIVEGASEADAIIENMLSFGSPERLRMERIDGKELVAEALALALTPELRDRLDLRSIATAPPFLGDRIKLRQALRNLVANAVEAQPGQGRIDVSLECTGPEVVVRVADAGPGIPAELRRKVLDPFFTTRVEGTGLGLALVATIARLHGGTVDLHAAPSPLGGAEAILRIPYQPADTSAEPLFSRNPR